MSSCRSVAALLLALGSCTPGGAAGPGPSEPVAPSKPASDELPAGDPALAGWQPATRSPRATQTDGLARRLSALCARQDGALDAVAERLSERLLDGRPALDPAELTFELRAAGAPYVWPRSWSYSGPGLDSDDAVSRAERWLASPNSMGKPTCGAAHRTGNGQAAVTLVLADALADLEPLTTTAHVGQWLDVTAHALVPTSDAKVVVLGPRGGPRAIPTSVDQGTVRARFAPSSRGSWLVQVVADVATGPRPVAEALVHADASPPAGYHAAPAPGEEAGASGGDDGDALVRMVNAARASEGLGPLRRDADLDTAAREQAEAMRDARVLGHDVGKGSVGDRLAALGLSPRAYGENVARAATPGRAHRAIWSSPSHRSNVLEPRYDSVGVGVARGPEGLWVAEVFADAN